MEGHPQVVSLQPDSLAGIWQDIRRTGEALGVGERGEELAGTLQRRMKETATQAGTPVPLRVACVEWMEPLMDAGYWMPELIEMAGAVPVPFAAAPDVVIAAPCGFDLAHTERELHWLERRPEWATLRRVYIADGNQFFNRPGPRVVETLAIIMEMLYPDQVAPRHRGGAWRAII
jgi:iron complex transport system substrate-binding protein